MSRIRTFRSRFNVLARKETADEIAAFLKKKGVTGESVASKCPIANYLKPCGHTSSEVYVVAFESSLRIGIEDSGEGEYYDVVNTPAMRSFIVRFDEGGYPELEAYV